ncbi:mitochondrial thiamine pyrophosphate carrier-like [Lycorma delicatula]|uniref:mitochondrial thiamine pyrophosphate carrier-like n=1 Tax=Lycorma delicatula TaxID=130591 RepID=UPI003F5160BF
MPHSDDNITENILYNPNYGIAGAVSGVVTRCLCQPLDVVKIRFQLQTEPISRKSKDSKYKSTLQAFHVIWKEEGLNALWKGHVAAQLLSFTYGVVQFQTYGILKNKARELNLIQKDDISKTSGIHFLCGGTAGCLATITSYPFDIIRTRLIAQGNNRLYNGIFHGLRSIYQQEGLLSYWRGLSPSLLVAGPYIGLQFTFYEFFKTAVVYIEVFSSKSKDYESSKETNPFGNLVSGLLAGVAAKTTTYPFDLARKRMQMQEFQHARVGYGSNFWCSSLTTCFVETYKKEKIRGMYKGLFPSLIKAGLYSAVHFTIYEETLNFLNKYYRR